MGLLLYILLFIFLYYTIKVAWKFYGIYRKLHDVTKQFRDFGNSHGNGGYTAGGAQTNDGSRQTSAGNSAYRGNTYSKSSTTPTGEVVEDRRTEDEINRKIFTQEEGEYVDYEEVK